MLRYSEASRDYTGVVCSRDPSDYLRMTGSDIIMEETIFSKIIAKKIPAKIVFEDEHYIVIEDVNPQAPVHVLVIPKKPIATLNDLTPEDAEMIGGMFILAGGIMRKLGQTDYRTVFNCGPGAQQSVFHLHLHVLAGRPFTWPPG